MINRFLSCLLFYFMISSASGQNELSHRQRHLMQRADHYRLQQNYLKAIELYKDVVAEKSDYTEAMTAIAEAYYKLNDFENTMIWYDSTLRHKMLSGEEAFQYTNTLQMLGKNEKVRLWLNNYLQAQPHDSLLRQKLTGLDYADTFFKDSSQYTLTSLPINTSGSEFAPILYQNGIILVSNTQKQNSKKKGNEEEYLDLLYYDLKDSVGITYSLGEVINSKLHEGPATLFDSERKIIFTRNHKTKRSGNQGLDIIHFQLFFSEKDDNNQWKEPILLSINDPTYSTGHPTITSQGTTLYFSSNMEGGFGGADLYKSEWLDNQWSKPQNLGVSINTPGNEMFPSLFQDSVLYFASDGYKGLGGLDIYKTNLKTPSGVFNVGYPINSRKDDFSISLFPDEKRGFFASARDGGKGKDDIYEFRINEIPVVPSPAVITEAAPVKIFYTIQILALRNPKLVSKTFMKQLKEVVRHKGKDGIYRYTYGKYEGAEDAFKTLQEIRAMGYADAFIRNIDLYSELSEKPGENTDALYEMMARNKN
ncbi:MAG: hypothetical protein EBR30_20470 [Cytophagia bacterium]|nr:hypothetical protein [Cytophagia bacterium]